LFLSGAVHLVILQTFMGLAPLDLTVLAGILFVVSAVCVIWAFGTALRGIRAFPPWGDHMPSG
jgi:hypothetical protein